VNKKMKKDKIIEYGKIICSSGEDITNTSNLILFSSKRNLFFKKLGEYLKFYSDLKVSLLKHYKNDKVLFEKIKKLPDINFEDYSIPKLTQIILMLALPIGAIIFLLQMNYLKETKNKIKEAIEIYSEVMEIIIKK
jgi:hypothetical protein